MNEPTFILFLIKLTSGISLLIWSIHLVRRSVEKSFSNKLKSVIRQTSSNRFLSLISGTVIAFLLQSATAVAVLISEFIKRGTHTLSVTGLIMLIGADLGSALVAKILIIPQNFVADLLLIVGALLFLKSKAENSKQIGQILLGIALVFISLDIIRTTIAPLSDTNGMHLITTYIKNDMLTAFLIGTLFAWTAHSSITAVLVFTTFAVQGILPTNATVVMILGANLGGSLIPLGLTLTNSYRVKEIIFSNILLRGAGAILMMIVFVNTPSMLAYIETNLNNHLINLHIFFNLCLAFFSLIFSQTIIKFIKLFISTPPQNTSSLSEISALDPKHVHMPDHALDCCAREILQIGQRTEVLYRAALPLLKVWDVGTAHEIDKQHQVVIDTHLTIKLYLAQVTRQELSESQATRSMDLAAIAAQIAASSDVIRYNLLNMAKNLKIKNLSFSTKGYKDIDNMADMVMTNTQLALNVMMTQNPESARQLIANKENMRNFEQKLQRNHLGRLRDGFTESIETSNLHQETLRALKQINTAFCMIGYPILSRTGDLIKSRLISKDI